jgi:hypothetical protein
VGKNVEIFKANGQYSSPYAASKYRKVAWGVKGTGWGLGARGVGTDLYGLVNWKFNPNPNAYKVSPGTFGVNTIMAGVGTFGGPIGWGLSSAYFLIGKPDLNYGGPVFQYTLTPADALRVSH